MKIKGLTTKLAVAAIAMSTTSAYPKQTQKIQTPVIQAFDEFIKTNTNTKRTLSLCDKFQTAFIDKSKEFIESINTATVKSKTSSERAFETFHNQKNMPSSQTVVRSTLDGGRYWITGKNILYIMPKSYKVTKAEQRPQIIANMHSISKYRLQIANPNINMEKTIPAGTTIKIPGRYIIKSGSVKNFNDVAKTTGIDRHYIKDILMGIEGRKSKPDLVCKSDNVKSTQYPNGCPTIGFGHTGRLNGKPIVIGKTKITEKQAFEILAQDILDAKLDAIVYMGKETFSRTPKSIQTGIIDVVFNKGVEPFTRKGSPTRLLKGNLERQDWAGAAANTVLAPTNKGLKKRNIYRVIMSTSSLSAENRKKTLKLTTPHYKETLKLFSGADRRYLERAWKNAQNGKTYGYFSK